MFADVAKYGRLRANKLDGSSRFLEHAGIKLPQQDAQEFPLTQRILRSKQIGSVENFQPAIRVAIVVDFRLHGRGDYASE